MVPLSYYKVSEPAAWVNVDRQSGDLKVANTIDRESKFVQDGKYTLTMKAVDAGKVPVNQGDGHPVLKGLFQLGRLSHQADKLLPGRMENPSGLCPFEDWISLPPPP